jgi:hypothetical protein
LGDSDGSDAREKIDLLARYEILTNVWEGTPLAVLAGVLIDLYPGVARCDVQDAAKPVFQDLLDRKLIRIRRGINATAYVEPKGEEEVPLDGLDECLDEAFRWKYDGVREVPDVCVCGTELTEGAWRRARAALQAIGMKPQ